MDEDYLQGDELAVYVGDEFPSHPVWTGENSVTPDPAVHNTPTLFVCFYRRFTTMFRLLFSFLEVRILVSKTSKTDVNINVLSHCHAGYERVIYKR